MKSWKILLSTLLIASLTGCGGGGGGGGEAVSGGGNSGSGNEGPGNEEGPGDGNGETPPPEEATYNSGVFLDSPVKGLRYSTPTLAGLTDVDGKFNYNDGEIVTFTLGGTVVGSTLGASTVTPFSLFNVQPPEKERIISNALFDGTSVQTLDKALNIASLLQNLDADQNPDNGIDLGNADAALTDITLDFSKYKAIDFNDKSNMRSVRETMSLNREPVSLERIATHLYSSLGIEIESSAAAGTTGSSGLQSNFSTNFEYDESGNVVLEEIDTNGDGVIDITKTFRYENSLLVETSNSKLNTTETLNYDSAQQLIERLTRYGDGRTSIESYSYSNGLVTQFSFDEDGDGQADRITYYIYDANDQLIETRIDKDGDGSIDIKTTASYFSDGKQATHTEDKNNNGIPNLIIAYVYDADGNRKSFNISVDENATPSETSLFTYSGKLVKEFFVLDANYRLKLKETYYYDSQDRRKEVRRDTNGDGNINVRIQYKYDENGNRILAAEDHNDDGIADKVWRQSVNSSNLVSPWKKILRQG